MSNPAQALGIAAPAAALRYAEVKAVVGGVTAIQGSPPVTRRFPGWMVRNVEKEAIGVKTADLPVGAAGDAPSSSTRRAGAWPTGASFIYHLAEGVDPALRKEFTLLDDHGCVGDGLIGIHSTALDRRRLTRRGSAAGGGAVVWSPFSNLWLYGGTTDVARARALPGCASASDRTGRRRARATCSAS